MTEIQRPTPHIIDQQQSSRPVQSARGVVSDIGDSRVTARAEQIRYHTDEQMIWQARPSFALLVPRAVKFAFLLAVILVGIRFLYARIPEAARLATVNPGYGGVEELHRHFAPVAPAWQTLLIEAVLAWMVLSLIWLSLRILTTKYAATSQRLFVQSGVFNNVNVPFEIHRLGGAVIHGNLLLKMFGVANLTIDSPSINLMGIKNADYVRDILRSGGQIEAQRVDKIRWR